MSTLRWKVRGIGRGGGFPSLITGIEASGPDISGFVCDRSEAYALVDLFNANFVNGPKTERGGVIDRAYVDYRPTEPGWLQVKVCAEEKYAPLLERLYKSVNLRDGYIDAKLIAWALDPERQDAPWAYSLTEILEEKLRAHS